MSSTYIQGEQPHILSTFTTTFWCEACMQTRVVLVSKVQSDILHIVDYIVNARRQEKEKYVSYLVQIGNSMTDEEYIMDSIDEGHVKNVHPELFEELANPEFLLRTGND